MTHGASDAIPAHTAGGWTDRIVARLTRRHLVAGAGLLGLAGLAARELPPVAAQGDVTTRDAFNALITLEALAVTFYGVARDRDTKLELTDEITRFVRAVQCQEEAHFHFFEAGGGAPTTTTFTIDPKRIADQPAFLARAFELEEIQVGACMAAARAFAAAGDLRLVEIAYQIGAVEAQHQALLREFNGERTPANRAFARWRFAAPADALAAVTELGYIGGDGDEVAFPGPVDRYCRGVTGLVPETTEDAPPEELGPAASPIASPAA